MKAFVFVLLVALAYIAADSVAEVVTDSDIDVAAPIREKREPAGYWLSAEEKRKNHHIACCRHVLCGGVCSDVEVSKAACGSDYRNEEFCSG